MVEDDSDHKENSSGDVTHLQWFYLHMPKCIPPALCPSPNSVVKVPPPASSPPHLADCLLNLDMVTAQLQPMTEAIKTLSSPTPPLATILQTLTFCPPYSPQCLATRFFTLFIMTTLLSPWFGLATLLTTPTQKHIGLSKNYTSLWAVQNSGTTTIFCRLAVMVNGLIVAYSPLTFNLWNYP